jgi:hypothetical protein
MELHEVRKQLDRGHGLEGEAARDLLRPICAALLQLGVQSVEMEYAGCGDDGAIESTTYTPETVEVPEELEEIVESWTYAVLPGGWEINEGGQGSVSIDVSNSTARIDHGWNVIAIESATYEIG